MISSNEVVNLIKKFSLTDRLKIVEEILKNIREERVTQKTTETEYGEIANGEPSILSLAGIIDEEEAQILSSAIEESRKIDSDDGANKSNQTTKRVLEIERLESTNTTLPC